METGLDSEILEKLGLTKEQAKIYLVLIEGGIMPARAAAARAGLGRPLAYKVLDQLKSLGLAEEKEVAGKVTLFTAGHPDKLKTMIEVKNQEMKKTELAFGHTLGGLISKYNLNAGKPNVQFYEGESGADKVMGDLPQTATEIWAYIDPEKLTGDLKERNALHIARRKKLGIKKYILLPDTDFARERAVSYDPAITEYRILKGVQSFPSAIEIYENKVSFLTLEEKKTIGLIVEDAEIFAMMKLLFDAQWQTALTA